MGSSNRRQPRERVPRQVLATWPRLLDIHFAAQYLSIGEGTVRDYIIDNLLHSVSLPGATLRDRTGRIISHSKNRRMVKYLLDREDLDRFIESIKAND